MALMVVAHPDPTFTGRVAVDDVGLAFVGGFTGPTDVPTEVQAQLTAEGFTLNATPGANYGGRYILDTDLEDDDSEAMVTLRAAFGTRARGIFVPPGWGTHWKAARDGGGLARIAVVGDSIPQGFDASDLYTTSFPHLLRASLQSQHGDGGSGFLGCAHTSVWEKFAPAYYSQFRVVASGAWTDSYTPELDGTQGAGPGGVFLLTPNAGDTLTFSHVRGTQVTVYLTGYAGAVPADVTIDGTAVGTVPADTGGGEAVTSATFTVSAGEHTVVVTTRAGGTGVYGVSGRNAAGVVLDNYGRSAGDSRTFVTVQSATAPTGQPIGAEWSGGYRNPCDLLIYAMGVNDANANLTGDAYLNNVRAFMNSVRQASATAATDVIFFNPHVGQWDDTSQKYHEYTQRMSGLADAYGAAYVDAWAEGRNSWGYYNGLGYWSNGHTGTGAAGTDGIHPGDAGHAHYASLLTTVLNAA